MIIKTEATGPMSVNTYLAFCEETKKGFLVDPGGYSERLAQLIRSEGVQLDYIILTHGHGDHIGGVTAFMREFPGAKLVCTRAEKEVLSDDRMSFASYFETDALPEPDLYAEDGGALAVGTINLTFLHTPGHTPGGLCILAGDVLFSGDTLFAQSVGRTDFPGGSFEALQQSIREKLFVLPDHVTVLPGHMGQTKIGVEKRGNPFI